MSTTVTTDGFDDARQALQDLVQTAQQAGEGAVEAEASQVADDMRSWVPVLTGELRDGIEFLVDGASATVGIFNELLFWAVWIEWGRRNAPAQPFATPAAEASRVRFPTVVSELVREAVT